MSDRTFAPEETTTAFREAAHWWRSLVGAVDDHQWAHRALGEWSIQELVAHGGRALKTVSEYVEGDVKDPTRIDAAAAYFRIVLAEQTPHVHIAARAKSEAVEHDDWVAVTDELWASADRVVTNVPPDTDLHLFVGEMRLDQYLATLVVELVVHGGDLARAIGMRSAPPRSAARVAVDVLADLADAEDLAAVAASLAGRPGAGPRTNVLG